MCPDRSPNPSELLAEAKSGMVESLGSLLELYANYLRLLAASQIDRRLRARVSPSDVVQETFYEAQRDFNQFRGGTERELLAWLRRILVNNLARLVERHVLAAKRDVRREISLERIGAAVERSSARLEEVLVDQGASPSSNVQNRERAAILADLLAELPGDYAEVLLSRHVKGLPFKEVAEQMERSEGAVRMLWMRAIGRLRRDLRRKGLI